MTEQNSISSAVFGLQNTLRDLENDFSNLQTNNNTEKVNGKL